MTESTKGTLLLVIIVSSAVVLVLDIIDFDGPLDVVSVAFMLVTMGLAVFVLRQQPREGLASPETASALIGMCGSADSLQGVRCRAVEVLRWRLSPSVVATERGPTAFSRT